MKLVCLFVVVLFGCLCQGEVVSNVGDGEVFSCGSAFENFSDVPSDVVTITSGTTSLAGGYKQTTSINQDPVWAK